MRFGARARGFCPGATRAASPQHHSPQNISETLFYSLSAHARALHRIPEMKRRKPNPTPTRRIPSGPGLVYRPRGPRPPHHATSARRSADPAEIPPPRDSAGARRPRARPPLIPMVETSREAGAASGAGRDRERSRAGGGERGGGAGLVCAAEGSEGRSAVTGGGGRAKMAAPCGPEESGVVNS